MPSLTIQVEVSSADPFDALDEVQEIADAIYDKWLELAITELDWSLDKYAAAMEPPTVASDGTITLTLREGDLAEFVELGSAPFDMTTENFRRIYIEGVGFRTLTANNPWRHPGIEARHLMERAVEEVPEETFLRVLGASLGVDLPDFDSM